MLQFKWDPFPELSTDRFLLRRLLPSDIQQMFILRSQKESMKFIGRPLAKSLQDVKELMERVETMFLNQEGINWAIVEKVNASLLLGTVGYYRMKKEHFRAEVGYQLIKDYHRKGIMTEVLPCVVRYGFEEMKLHSVEADVNPDNTASMKLLEKCNFILNGKFEETFFFEGKFYDSAVFSILNPVKYFDIYNE